jgi:predicted O-methyltransferase YrrM
VELVDYAKLYSPQTDKYDLGYVDEFYNKFFEPRRYSVQSLLEVGIAYGGSLLLWRDYFPNATIMGIDIYGCDTVENKERIIPIYTNAYSVDFVKLLAKESFDVVIDDGPHSFESMCFFLTHYIDLVKSGGLLVLEDIINPLWTLELLKLIDPAVGKITVYDMKEKQVDLGLKQLWANGLDVIVVEKY